MNNFFDTARIFMTKLRIERPSLVVAPRFTTTFFILWVIALTGLSYGHLWNKGEAARALSLLLSASAGLAALFMVLLNDPWYRFKIFIRQLSALVLLLAFLAIAGLAYSLNQWVPHATVSIHIAWIAGTIILGYLTLRSLFGAFLNARVFTEYAYPGMRSTSIIFFLFVINYVWWFADRVIEALQ